MAALSAALLSEIVVALERDRDLARRLRLALFGERGGDDLVGAKQAGVPRNAWRRAVRSGALPAVKVGREFRARRRDVDTWLAQLAVEPRERPEREEPDDDASRVARGLPLDLE